VALSVYNRAMRHINPQAATAIQCLDALRLTQDPVRLHEASSAELVSAAASCAKALVRVAEATEHIDQRASVLHVIDRAGRLLGRELRRREPNMDH
jgi:N-acyl-D-aspartate/D-glutamate deacylase